ncbi:MAG TPA: C69 family dipeptidase [Prolixibacteraceae bacterium]|nr:C69 family dipeptidase [Prolixibacteraceae bacterium]HPS12536.1 C69 family dipeptidase [Prolixibacteraceae bacterium]
MKKSFLFLFASLFISGYSIACTNYLVTKGATADGSTMITYAADSHTLYGELYYTPAATHAPGEMLDIHEWDTGEYLGKIEQVPQTYSVIGNMNEHQVAIGETTYGGRPELQSQPTATIDYGSLIYVSLQRSKTAREAIETMTGLVEKYGYRSEGESFSISDPNEVWILEMIGKGEFEKGAVWVALRVPDGYVCAHANQARITTFPLNDSKNCLYSKDVISFAINRGWYDGVNKDFSFSDVYNPLTFDGARFCEARVWSAFNKITSGMDTYLDYAKGIVKFGAHGFASNRMPLWIKPDKLLTVSDVMAMMRDHFEGTPLDMTSDIGAGPYKLPYRWRPLTWKADSVEYCNERAVSTQQTGFSFIAQSRSNYPDPIGGINWFGVDDTYSTCYIPMYCGMNKVPHSFEVGNGDMLTYSETSAFWAFNAVANFAYLRYDTMITDVIKVQKELENSFFKMVPAIDQAAITLWNSGNQQMARDFITNYSVTTANNTVDKWKELFHFLLVKYKDGNIMKENNGVFERTETGMAPYPAQPGYPESWRKNVAGQTGDKLKVIGTGSH